jgi:hypothetical protein
VKICGGAPDHLSRKQSWMAAFWQQAILRYGRAMPSDTNRLDRGQEILDTLIAWTRENLDWPGDDNFPRITRATLADATRTCAAAAELTRQGYGPESLKLGRSLLPLRLLLAAGRPHGPDLPA